MGGTASARKRGRRVRASKLGTERPIAVVRGEGACATLFCHAGLRLKHLDAFDRRRTTKPPSRNGGGREG